MRVMIAGGAGYVGCALTPKLLSRGHDVEIVDLLWFGNNLDRDIKVHRRDVMDLQEEDLRGVDVVIFLAGLSNDPMANHSPAQNFIDNASAPAYLSYIAKRTGVRRYIYGGSCSVYGYAVDRLYDEDAPATSNYPYGISKLQGEFGCLQLADKTFSVISLRKGTVCGYSPRMRLDLVINTMFKCAIQEGVITVNNPAIWRPVVAIQDVVDAYVCAVEAPSEISGVFNIASGNHTVGEIAHSVSDGIRDLLNVDARIVVNNMTDLRNYKVSCAKASNVLGFHPRFTIKDIVCELAENVDKFKDFGNRSYYNISTFEAMQGPSETQYNGAGSMHRMSRSRMTSASLDELVK